MFARISFRLKFQRPRKTEIYLLAFDLPLPANVWQFTTYSWREKELKLIEIDVLNVCLCFYSHVPFTYEIIIHFHLTFINFDSIGMGFANGFRFGITISTVAHVTSIQIIPASNGNVDNVGSSGMCDAKNPRALNQSK